MSRESLYTLGAQRNFEFALPSLPPVVREPFRALNRATFKIHPGPMRLHVGLHHAYIPTYIGPNVGLTLGLNVGLY